MKTQIINKLTKNILLGILATSVILILTSCEKKIKFHYQPTKTKNLSILFLYYSYSNVYDVVISFLKPYLPSKKGHLCGCRALVAAYPALGVCSPAFSYYPHQI